MGFVSAYREAIASGEKKAFLDLLNNGMPYFSSDGNLELSYLNKATNTATRWRSWWEIREDAYLLRKSNQRLIGHPEVVFDIDPTEGEGSKDFEWRIKATIARLKRDGLLILGVFSTGSRGVHIHGLLLDLTRYSKEETFEIKRFLLKKYGADEQKATPRCMIALEGEPHWKTGKKKVMIQ